MSRNQFLDNTEGQYISKANCQAVNSSKKRANKFNFTTKGQIISKCLFDVVSFSQKTNENKSICSKVEFFRSFFGRIQNYKKSF